MIAANTCTTNLRGFCVGGRAADMTSNGNLFFNNVCRENRQFGVLAGNRNATGNYFAQFVRSPPSPDSTRK